MAHAESGPNKQMLSRTISILKRAQTGLLRTASDGPWCACCCAPQETYLHRIGRTARAGAAGRALTFVEDNDRALLKQVLC